MCPSVSRSWRVLVLVAASVAPPVVAVRVPSHLVPLPASSQASTVVSHAHGDVRCVRRFACTIHIGMDVPPYV